jgi:Uracil-DNA glycosylase
MKKKILSFYNKYKNDLEKQFGKIHIPKLDPENGVPGMRISLMFINERPGRIGPGQSDLISFHNPDPSANRFKRLFSILGIARKKIVITNTCIFYPINKQYRDKTPNEKELEISIKILKNQIKRIKPKIIVTMGNLALHALKKIYPESNELKSFELKNNIGSKIVGSNNRPNIFPLYHTSNRAAITRKEKDQKKDWRKLKGFINT